MKNLKIVLWLVGSSLLFATPGAALNTALQGQFSTWTITARDDGEWRHQAGMRYLPQLTTDYALSNDWLLDAEVMVNGYWAVDNAAADTTTRDADLYRVKLRMTTPQTETRLGLQKINFGPARLLRSLRWFDRLDPRDPLQLTDGVYALRFKYSTLTNASVWLWGLYGNDDPKGYETLPSDPDEPEFGGRLQYPLWNGEVAATFHTRQVDAALLRTENFREHRFAMDGRWEVEIGFWFEAVAQQQDTDMIADEWTKMLTLGADYTFAVSNGLHVVAEHLLSVSAEELAGWDDDTQVSALSVNYPLGLWDSLSAIGYYAWEPQQYSQYVRWQRMYDTLTLTFSLFHYPEAAATAALTHHAGLRGYGGQIMVTYYH